CATIQLLSNGSHLLYLGINMAKRVIKARCHCIIGLSNQCSQRFNYRFESGHEINKLVVNVVLFAIVFIHRMLIIIMPPKMGVVMSSGVFVLVHALGWRSSFFAGV